MANPLPPLPETTSSIGGTIEQKHPNHIRISSINPNGITISNLEATIQNVLDMDIDIQCYNEINLDTTKSDTNQKLQHTIRKMSPASEARGHLVRFLLHETTNQGAQASLLLDVTQVE